MQVFVVTEHFDRGSDEVSVRAVFDSREKAEQYIAREYEGWEWVGEEVTHRTGWYSDPIDDTMSDYVFIDEMEVE